MRFSLNFLLFIMVLLHNGKFCNVFCDSKSFVDWSNVCQRIFIPTVNY